MMKPWDLYPRLVSDTYRTIADDNARRQVQYRWILKFLLLFVGSASLMNFVNGNHWKMGVLTAAIAFSYFIFYLIIYFGKDKGVMVVSALIGIETLVIFIGLMISGAMEGFAVVWILILPTIVMILMGRRAGFIFCVITFGIMAFFFYTPPGMSLLLYPYDSYFIQRLPLVFILMTAVGYFSETLRMITVQQLRESRLRIESVYQNQYSSIQDRIHEAKRTRHDLRHHFVMINHFLEEGKVSEAQEYISKYYKTIPFEEKLTYCDHYGINALLTYCHQRSKEIGVEKNIQVSYPKELPIPDDDLTVVFGNLLENALDASQAGRKKDKNFVPKIDVRGAFDGNVLTFSIRNKAHDIAEKNKDDIYISSKHEGTGIGLASVRGVVEKHNGVMQVKQENGEFIVNVMMR